MTPKFSVFAGGGGHGGGGHSSGGHSSSHASSHSFSESSHTVMPIIPGHVSGSNNSDTKNITSMDVNNNQWDCTTCHDSPMSNNYFLLAIIVFGVAILVAIVLDFLFNVDEKS